MDVSKYVQAQTGCWRNGFNSSYDNSFQLEDVLSLFATWAIPLCKTIVWAQNCLLAVPLMKQEWWSPFLKWFLFVMTTQRIWNLQDGGSCII